MKNSLMLGSGSTGNATVYTSFSLENLQYMESLLDVYLKGSNS